MHYLIEDPTSWKNQYTDHYSDKLFTYYQISDRIDLTND